MVSRNVVCDGCGESGRVRGELCNWLRKESPACYDAKWMPRERSESQLRRRASSQPAIVAMLLVGVIIGAGLIFGTLSLTGSLTQKTATDTITSPVTVTNKVNVTTTVTTTFTSLLTLQVTVTTSGSTVSFGEVSTSVSSCTQSGAEVVCTLSITNSGTFFISVNSCTINLAGSLQAGTFAYGYVGITPQKWLAPGTTQAGATCTVQGTEPAVGTQAVGSLALGNGTTVPFLGTWSEPGPSMAQVSVSAVNLTAAVGNSDPAAPTCQSSNPAPGSSFIQFVNTGGTGASIQTISFTFGGSTPSQTVPAGCNVATGLSVYVIETGLGGTGAASGSQFKGTAVLSDGETVSFTGTFG